VAATMHEQDQSVPGTRWGELERRRTAGDNRCHRQVRRRRELGVQFFGGDPDLVEVGDGV
jgi:hypothetical protein